MKRFIRSILVYILCGCLLFCTNTVVMVNASENSPSDFAGNTPDGYDPVLLSAYEELCEYISYYYMLIGGESYVWQI